MVTTSTSVVSSSSATPTQAKHSSSPTPSGGLSKGALAGIVLAGLVGLIIVLGVILLLFRLKKKRDKAAAGTAEAQTDTAYDGQANYEYNAVGVKKTTPPQYENTTEAQYSRMDLSAPLDPARNPEYARGS
jgi:predicted lipid-binding transport protein (Tim44 family)